MRYSNDIICNENCSYKYLISESSDNSVLCKPYKINQFYHGENQFVESSSNISFLKTCRCKNAVSKFSPALNKKQSCCNCQYIYRSHLISEPKCRKDRLKNISYVFCDHSDFCNRICRTKECDSHSRYIPDIYKLIELVDVTSSVSDLLPNEKSHMKVIAPIEIVEQEIEKNETKSNVENTQTQPNEENEPTESHKEIKQKDKCTCTYLPICKNICMKTKLWKNSHHLNSISEVISSVTVLPNGAENFCKPCNRKLTLHCINEVCGRNCEKNVRINFNSNLNKKNKNNQKSSCINSRNIQKCKCNHVPVKQKRCKCKVSPPIIICDRKPEKNENFFHLIKRLLSSNGKNIDLSEQGKYTSKTNNFSSPQQIPENLSYLEDNDNKVRKMSVNQSRKLTDVKEKRSSRFHSKIQPEEYKTNITSISIQNTKNDNRIQNDKNEKSSKKLLKRLNTEESHIKSYKNDETNKHKYSVRDISKDKVSDNKYPNSSSKRVSNKVKVTSNSRFKVISNDSHIYNNEKKSLAEDSMKINSIQSTSEKDKPLQDDEYRKQLERKSDLNTIFLNSRESKKVYSKFLNPYHEINYLFIGIYIWFPFNQFKEDLVRKKELLDINYEVEYSIQNKNKQYNGDRLKALLKNCLNSSNHTAENIKYKLNQVNGKDDIKYNCILDIVKKFEKHKDIGCKFLIERKERRQKEILSSHEIILTELYNILKWTYANYFRRLFCAAASIIFLIYLVIFLWMIFK